MQIVEPKKEMSRDNIIIRTSIIGIITNFLLVAFKMFVGLLSNSIAIISDAVNKLILKEILPSIEKGLCAAVYTQVSDIEEEINGLMTYNRKILKVQKNKIKKTNDLLKIID